MRVTPIARLMAKPPGSDISDVIRAVEALKNIWSNGDALTEEAAYEAHQHGRAAFWTTATYHNQAATLLAHAANCEGLDRALARHADDGHPSHAARTPYLLATLVPLNRQARADLEQAHAELGKRLASRPAAMPVYRFPMAEAAE